jgi:hypothetical protein
VLAKVVLALVLSEDDPESVDDVWTRVLLDLLLSEVGLESVHDVWTKELLEDVMSDVLLELVVVVMIIILGSLIWLTSMMPVAMDIMPGTA